MGHSKYAVLIGSLLLAGMTAAQTLTTPLFPHKDGEADAALISGSNKDLEVSGGSKRVVSWILYQTLGRDLAGASKAVLTLYVNSLSVPGTLNVHGLTGPLFAPENNVKLADVKFLPDSIGAKVDLTSGDVEKVLNLDITALVKKPGFEGLALTSTNGLLATFGSKESAMQPLIILSYNALGGAAGPKGDKGDPGATGPAGPKGDPGAAGPTGPAGPKGDSGAVGKTGAAGAAGPAGATGPEGAIGPAGATGSAGAPGPAGGAGPRSKFTRFDRLAVSTLALIPTVMTKMYNIGSFVKDSASTFILLELHSPISLQGTVNAEFELRIDDVANATGASIWVKSTDQGRFFSMAGVYPGLAAGTHTISAWVRGQNAGATNALLDPGNFGGHVLVTETY